MSRTHSNHSSALGCEHFRSVRWVDASCVVRIGVNNILGFMLRVYHVVEILADPSKKDAAPRGKSDQEKSYASKGGLPPEMLHERCAGLAEAARQVCKEERAQQLLLEFGSKTTH